MSKIFPWESSIPDPEVLSTEVFFHITDDIDVLVNKPDELHIYVSLEFEKTVINENTWSIKKNPTLFFEFQNRHTTRNTLLDLLRATNKTYISDKHDSVYELICLVKDFTMSTKYQVLGMKEPSTVYNPCRGGSYTLNEKDKLYVDLFNKQLKFFGEHIQELKDDKFLTYGMVNVNNLVITLVVITYHIYTTENKHFIDSFYSNHSLRLTVYNVIENIFNKRNDQ